MSAVEGLPAPLPSVDLPTLDARPDALPALCPYLATPDGNWRSASAVREHRCTAVSPPVPLALEKQRRLCLVEAHLGCATYGAAIAAQGPSRERPPGHLRPVARMTPVILDQGRVALRIPDLRADRLSGQAVLVGVLGLALVAILLARPSGDPGTAGPVGANAAPSPLATPGAPTDAAAGVPTATITAEPTATDPAPASAEPSAAPSAPAASPSPTADQSAEPVTSGATYRVKSGDTLSAIAGRFGTTTRVLMQLNGIVDPGKLRIGQVIKLP
jgi:LysM repeat protein